MFGLPVLKGSLNKVIFMVDLRCCSRHDTIVSMNVTSSISVVAIYVLCVYIQPPSPDRDCMSVLVLATCFMECP